MWGLNIIRALFAPRQEKSSEKIIYFGEGFGKGEGRGKNLTPDPDENGKTYFRFRLIVEGEHKGKYVSVPNFYATRSEYRDEIAENEMRDILESGFDIYAPDPKSSK